MTAMMAVPPKYRYSYRHVVAVCALLHRRTPAARRPRGGECRHIKGVAMDAHIPHTPSPPSKRPRTIMAVHALTAPVRTASLSDVIGDPLCAGSPMPLGPVLALIDVAAGRCAATFSLGSVVTGCFDEVVVFRVPRHGDVVTAQADVVAVGRSSVLVRVKTEVDVLGKDGIQTEVLAKCLATFVAVDNGKGVVRKIDTRLELNVIIDSPRGMVNAQVLQGEFKAERKVLSEENVRTLAGLADTRVSFSQLYEQRPPREVRIADTRVVVRKQYLPRHLNHGGVVFGGDILDTLDAVAMSCARRASLGTARFATVAIKGLSFLKPTELTKVLQVEAIVVASSQRFMAVVVRTFIDENHDGKELLAAHAGIFHMVAIGPDGQAVEEVEVGVEKVDPKGDEHLADFYRVMALPLPEIVKNAWVTQDDVYPAVNFVTY